MQQVLLDHLCQQVVCTREAPLPFAFTLDVEWEGRSHKLHMGRGDNASQRAKALCEGGPIVIGCSSLVNDIVLAVDAQIGALAARQV